MDFNRVTVDRAALRTLREKIAGLPIAFSVSLFPLADAAKAVVESAEDSPVPVETPADHDLTTDEVAQMYAIKSAANVSIGRAVEIVKGFRDARVMPPGSNPDKSPSPAAPTPVGGQAYAELWRRLAKASITGTRLDSPSEPEKITDWVENLAECYLNVCKQLDKIEQERAASPSKTEGHPETIHFDNFDYDLVETDRYDANLEVLKIGGVLVTPDDCKMYVSDTSESPEFLRGMFTAGSQFYQQARRQAQEPPRPQVIQVDSETNADGWLVAGLPVLPPNQRGRVIWVPEEITNREAWDQAFSEDADGGAAKAPREEGK